MKITHVYSQAGIPGQSPIGDGTKPDDVFGDLRSETLLNRDVVIVETHQFAVDEFLEVMDADRYDKERVQILPAREVTKTIHDEGKDTTFKAKVYHDCSAQNNARYIANHLKGCKTVVIWEPLVEAGDLDHLDELPQDIHVVIFHCVSDKYGVVVEGNDDPDSWETEFPVMGECELAPPEVIVDELLLKGCIHVWAGMFESYKTVATIELCAAIIGNRAAFDHFPIRKRYPVLYLCPDMSPELFQEYTRPFGLMAKPEFRWQRPGSDVFHSIDSPVLQRAVRDRILVLDTMLDYAGIQKAFESGEWIAFFKKLRRLINVCGCAAIVMLVHPTKTGARSTTIDPSEYLKDSVTFGGKIDVGLAFSKLESTSQVFIQRIKGRGFKKQQVSFTITYLDDDGNSNLDRGRFPVYLKPGEAGRKEDHTPTSGRKPNPQKEEQAQFILQLRAEGKTFKEIATQAELPETTVRRYYNQVVFKGEATNDSAE